MSASRRPFRDRAVPRNTRLALLRISSPARASSTSRAFSRKFPSVARMPAARTWGFFFRRRSSSRAKSRRSASEGSSRSTRRGLRANQDRPSQSTATASRASRATKASQPRPGASTSTVWKAVRSSWSSSIRMTSMKRAAAAFNKIGRNVMSVTCAKEGWGTRRGSCPQAGRLRPVRWSRSEHTTGRVSGMSGTAERIGGATEGPGKGGETCPPQSAGAVRAGGTAPRGQDGRRTCRPPDYFRAATRSARARMVLA